MCYGLTKRHRCNVEQRHLGGPVQFPSRKAAARFKQSYAPSGASGADAAPPDVVLTNLIASLRAAAAAASTKTSQRWQLFLHHRPPPGHGKRSRSLPSWHTGTIKIMPHSGTALRRGVRATAELVGRLISDCTSCQIAVQSKDSLLRSCVIH